MKFGIIITGGEPAEQVRLAQAAEATGWDGVFTWMAFTSATTWRPTTPGRCWGRLPWRPSAFGWEPSSAHSPAAGHGR